MNQDLNNELITSNIKANNNHNEILKSHFSHCFDKDGNFLFDKFKEELQSNEINFSKESYGLDWLGKSYARLLASDEVTTLLKEDVEFNTKPENVNSQNLLIKGDNLEVLKHLSNAYHEKIKMIYIDPPYNTGSDGFVYQDDRIFTTYELKELAGIDEDKAKRILDFTKSKSNSHSAWLTFMYPRLYIAKRLLKDDGVIFISIDDNEVAQLRLLMDEIFGEENFVAELPTIMNLKGNNDEFAFSGTHEYTIVFSKNKSKSIFNEFRLNEEENKKWEEDELGYFKKGATLKRTGENSPRKDRPYLFYPIFIHKENNDISIITDEEHSKLYNKNLKIFDDSYLDKLCEKYENNGYQTIIPFTDKEYMTWRWSLSKLRKQKNDIIIVKNKNEFTFYKKQRPNLGELPSKKPKTIFYKPEYSSGNGTAQLKEIFNIKIFSNPKPRNLLKDFMEIGMNQTDLILDFFAGSGTTGDAVTQLNAEDGGNRKYILVQLPEKIDEKKSKTAYDFVKNELLAPSRTGRAGEGLPTIFDITKERLIRAAKKIKEESISKNIAEKTNEIEVLNSKLDLEDKESKINKLKSEIENLKNQDLGFKVFETIPIWDDYIYEAKKLEEQDKLFDFEKLNDEDIKTFLTTWKTYDGLPLTVSLLQIDLNGYTAYKGNNKLYLMNKGFTTDNLVDLLQKLDNNKDFDINSIICFGYNFDSKNLREISENIKTYTNKKNSDLEFIVRY